MTNNKKLCKLKKMRAQMSNVPIYQPLYSVLLGVGREF